jgi:hypothetical protein
LIIVLYTSATILGAGPGHAMRSEPAGLDARLTIIEAGFLFIVTMVGAAEIVALSWIAGIMVRGA